MSNLFAGDDWGFRYGATAWKGPYASPEEALTTVANNFTLTQAEEDLVVAMILMQMEKRDQVYTMKDDHSALMVTWQESRINKEYQGGWYIRVTRKEHPTFYITT